MRVVLNQLPAWGFKTGVGHYTAQLGRHLRRQAGTYRIEGFPHRSLRHARTAWDRFRSYLETQDQGIDRIEIGGQQSGVQSDLVRHLRRYGRATLEFYFRALCARRRYSLYHEPNFIAMPSDVPTAATLHDLSALLHPEWHPSDRVAHFERHFRRSLAHCVHFFAISEFGRQEIIHTLNVRPERVSRTYMGVHAHLRPLTQDRVSRVLRKLDLPAKYLLYLGTIEPRKNITTLLKAYCALPSSLRSEWPLLLVGNWGWRTRDVAECYYREGRHRGVIHRTYVADEDLAAIYGGARALAYPSLYEGFGMPPLEMMACGGAVLSSTAGALQETVGGQAHLIDPHDIDGWRRALARVVTDDDWWLSLRNGAEAVARRYTWDQCAADTLQVYRSLCGQKTADNANVNPRPENNCPAAA